MTSATLEEEVRAIRESAGLTALPGVWAVYVRGEGAYEVLDRIVPCDLYMRDSQVRHTLLLDERGAPFADVYIGNDDGDFLLVGEGPSVAQLLEHLNRHTPEGADVRYEDLSTSHTVLSLNGPFSWEVMAALEGPGIIGFPYLSFFHPDPARTYIRAGKTGEFGYDLVVPRDGADALRSAILDAGAPFDCRAVSEEALRACALENWFYDVRRQSGAELSPVELQLQWRVSFKKEFVGAEAVRARRADPQTRRATAIRSLHAIAAGDDVLFDGATVGTVLDAAPSPTLGGWIGVALLEVPYAHAGIDRYTVQGAGVRTFSPPAVSNRSLYVNPQRHAYATRAEIAFPPAARTPWIG
jgi:aminomethyltransferase